MLDKYNINATTLRILALYRSDYSVGLHLRAIAKAIKIDVKAVQIHLKKLEALNVLSSAQKGRNREYRLNLNNSSILLYLALAELFATLEFMSIKNNFVIKRFMESVYDNDGIVLLFGSFARGNATKRSDIDLYIITKKPAKRAISQMPDLSNKINIQYATEESFRRGMAEKDPLVMEVVSNHVALIGAEQLCKILREYYARY